MNRLIHSLAVRAVAAILLGVLLLGGCVACAQPMQGKAKHPCCDPKGHCKPQPAQMDANECDRHDAALPETPAVAVTLADAGVPVEQSVAPLHEPVFSTPVDTSPPRLTPLRI